MKILSWNCEGLGAPWTVRTLTRLVKLHRPGLVFLSETKCNARRVDRVKNLMNYNGVGVDFVGKGGGLFLLWRKDVDVWLQSLSLHHIDVTVKSDDYPDRWHFLGFMVIRRSLIGGMDGTFYGDLLNVLSGGL
ncbi:UNVERIFIED_CONTAM: hypothetical protein Slati_1759100 [Sesamum latifolium]|uniref:Endonuclease/exonuclease/phosphatase domain-containing protein n=1 Tax=Sesamum latifolium TaxID=2727402 RepID=A0AAW2X0V8_9LAMI